MKVYLGADHRGFHLKEELKTWITESNEDLGANSFEKNDDYVDFSKEIGFAVCEDLKKGIESRGIVICGSGVGVDIAANKIKGIRCGLGFSEEQVTLARQHDDINVLALAADFIDNEQAKKMIKAFLDTPFLKEEKYMRRIDKITKIENG